VPTPHRSQDPLKICSLLQYVSDAKRMESAITQDWLTVYDLSYINGTILGALRRASSAIKDHCALLQLKSYGARKRSMGGEAGSGGAAAAAMLAAAPARPATVVKPFNLTRPNPRKVRRVRWLHP
jgi:hypothetical protein